MAGRKKDPQLEPKLLELGEPYTAADPLGSRKWLNCRLSDLQQRLGRYRVSKPVISRLLKAHNNRLRANSYYGLWTSLSAPVSVVASDVEALHLVTFKYSGLV